MTLDITTPRGQQSLVDELRAVDIFENQFKEFKYVHTDKSTSAKVDALLLRYGQLAGVALTSCRYNCNLDTFSMNWRWEWLLTWRKIAQGALLARLLQTPLVGFLYIVNEDVLLIQKLYDPKLVQRWVPPMRFEYTETRATINGGSVVRRNAFIKVNEATMVKRG